MNNKEEQKKIIIEELLKKQELLINLLVSLKLSIIQIINNVTINIEDIKDKDIETFIKEMEKKIKNELITKEQN